MHPTSYFESWLSWDPTITHKEKESKKPKVGKHKMTILVIFSDKYSTKLEVWMLITSEEFNMFVWCIVHLKSPLNESSLWTGKVQ